MIKARLPGPGTPVVVYGDTSGTCRENARWREWLVVADVAASGVEDDEAWELALTHLLEHQAHVLVVPGPETIGETADARERRIRDVSLRRGRLFYVDTGRFGSLPAAAYRSPRL